MSGIPGKGLAQGLGVTFRSMTKRSVTQEYPHVRPELPPRSRGVIALLEENCTSCMLCARECPDWCIYIDSHKETIPATTEGGRDRTRNVLDRFAIDYSLCMYCGICIDVCPFDALFWSPEFEYAEGDILELTHEKDRLRDWMPTVPAPPAEVPNAEPAKEVSGAGPARARRERPDAADRPARTERPERPARTERPEQPVREPAADATAPTVADELPADAIAAVSPEMQQAAEADATPDEPATPASDSAITPDEPAAPPSDPAAMPDEPPTPPDEPPT